MFTQMTWLFYKVIALQITKVPPNFDETIPARVSSFWTHQQGLPHPHQKNHICNNMKNVVSFYYKFLRTHHARGACYHFGTGIPSVSKKRRSTRRVNSIRDLFKALTSWDGLVKLWEGAFIVCNTITL